MTTQQHDAHYVSFLAEINVYAMESLLGLCDLLKVFSNFVATSLKDFSNFVATFLDGGHFSFSAHTFSYSSMTESTAAPKPSFVIASSFHDARRCARERLILLKSFPISRCFFSSSSKLKNV